MTQQETYNSDLEAVLAKQPFDEDTLLVYGDWLQEHGHPRGELISIQSQLTSCPEYARKFLRQKERDLLGQHGTAFVPYPIRHPQFASSLRWKRGFVSELHIGSCWHDVLKNRQAIEETLSHPSLRFMEGVEVSGGHLSLQDLGGALAGHNTLRRVTITGGVTAVAAILAIPSLEQFEGNCLDWHPKSHDKLKSLVITGTNETRLVEFIDELK